MLTNNFYHLMRSYLSGNQLTAGPRTISNTEGRFSYTDSNAYYAFRGFYNDTKNVITTAAYNANHGMAFGTGTVPPTLEDYWLSGDVITTLQIVACVITSDINNAVQMKNEVTVKNTSNTETVVINEMGIIGKFYYGSSGVACLVDRTVLDAPLTLAPGEQGVITYTFNLPIVQ